MNTQHIFRTTTVAALALGILTPSCIQIPMSENTKTVAKGTMLGATGGAAVGALAGMAIGGDEASTKKGAAIGTIVGALVGYVWSKSSVKKKQAYATNQQYVQANNSQLVNRINQLKQYNSMLSQQQSQGTKLNAQQLTQIKNGLSLINNDLSTAQEASKLATGTQLAELTQNIAGLNQQKSILEGFLSSLAQ